MTTLRQMRFLVALADTGNFSRAAELCHVTQSTLSTGLKEMEARLGVQVAERSTHSVLMTPVGRDLAERARDVLVRVGDFEARAKSEAEAGVTTLRLGAIPTVGPFLLPHALPMIRRLKPGMKVYLREELTEALVAGLIEGRLDLILIALPHELPPQITTHPLFEDGYSLATPRAHPLANLSLVEGPDLQGRDLLLLERGHCLQQHVRTKLPSPLGFAGWSKVPCARPASFSAIVLVVFWLAFILHNSKPVTVVRVFRGGKQILEKESRELCPARQPGFPVDRCGVLSDCGLGRSAQQRDFLVRHSLQQ
jgi:LysR family hydrogen peroxide-inducible transcriptional activator